ncbi:MAG: hypothetical protein ACR2QK_10505 [Acidimicrobiales bacterium]
MSKQKLKQAEQQRFSGPDLGELLDEVVTELGSTAAISAVNRIRSGGVAGFFCREEFEVVVDSSSVVATPRTDIESSAAIAAAMAKQAFASPAPSDRSPAVPSAAPGVAGQPVPGATGPIAAPTAPAVANQIVAPAVPGAAGQAAMPPPATGAAEQAAMPTMAGAAGQIVAPTVTGSESATDRSDLPLLPFQPVADPPPLPGRPGAPSTGPDNRAAEVFGGPRPPANGTDAGFMALLERRLDEASAAESPLVARRVQRQTPESEPAPAAPSPSTEPMVPAPGIAPHPDETAGDLKMLAAAPGPSAEFWLRLQRAQEELTGFMPVASSFVATIGPLSLITPIVRRLRAESRFASADVVVLTDRTEIVSEPQWRLVRSGNQLVEEAQQHRDGPTLLLIDVPVDLPNWVAPLQNRLRMAGVGLFRYAIPGNPTADILDEYRLASDVPYVLDLISRVSPERLVDFIAQRHPIASVSSAEMTAELLVAMREQVSVGR